MNDFGITTEDSTQLQLEESMNKIHHESYDQWINNFTLNLENIWNESSAKELLSSTNEKSIGKKDSSIIVIGRGPSIKKFNHLDILLNFL